VAPRLRVALDIVVPPQDPFSEISEKYVTTNLRLSEENHERLARLAADMGVSRNDAVNVLIREADRRDALTASGKEKTS
jgi:predicted HicB family RNase H-like nuclease